MIGPTTTTYECFCGRTEHRPAHIGMPGGWEVRDKGDTKLLLCADCIGAEHGTYPMDFPLQEKAGIAPRILLRSGIYIDLQSPDCSKVKISDIASGLSRMCRFSGQCDRFYSVAEHSVIASYIAPRKYAFAALMHDAAEALIGDVTSPLKSLLPEYRKIERLVEASLFASFGVVMDATTHQAVKCADKAMLEAEKRILFPEMPRSQLMSNSIGTASSHIGGWLPDEANRRFLERFYQLMPDAFENAQVAA